MHAAVGRPDHERGFHPRPVAYHLWKVVTPRHREQLDKGRLWLPEHHGAPAHNRERRLASRPFHALGLHAEALVHFAAGVGHIGGNLSALDLLVAADT